MQVQVSELQTRQRMQRVRQQLAHSEEVFDRIARLSTRAMEASGAVIAMVGLERNYFRARSGVSVAETPYNIAFFAQALAAPGVLLIPDLARDERFGDHALVTGDPNLRFYAGVAIQDPQGMPIGALCVVDTRPRVLDSLTESTYASTLADLSGLLTHELLMRSLTRTDPLTGLRNASYSEVDIESEWHRARRSQYPVTVLMVDIDHLGEFNETYGYPAGDRALREIAERLAAQFKRASDLLIRIGGGRMLVLLPEAEAADGLRMAEALRREVEALKLGDVDGNRQLTLSVGCATASRESGYSQGYQALVRQADSALRSAKAAGRNNAVHPALGEEASRAIIG